MMQLISKTIFISALAIAAVTTTMAQTDAELKRIAASQAAASPLYFEPDASTPLIAGGTYYTEQETMVRGGLPNFLSKAASGKTLTVGYIGGSITQAMISYRLQSAKYIQSKFPGHQFMWLNAGVSGTGTDLGSCRIDEQLLKHSPDLIFIEFAVNGGYQPGMEGMIRQIIRKNPHTDICLIYTVLEPHAKSYYDNVVPPHIQGLEKIATYYNLPSIHLGIELATMLADNKVIFKADTNKVRDKIVFSADGIHPLKAGGNIYAAALARGIDKLMKEKSVPVAHPLPAPLIANNWENAKMLDPQEVASFSKKWKKVKTDGHPFLRQFSAWFPYVMQAEKPGSSFSFKFKGTIFGVYNIGGPEVGQLAVTIDGKPVQLKELTGKGFRLYKSDSTGSDVMNLFNNFCNNRYRGQYDFVETEDGVHTVTITISDQKSDKRKILGENQLKDITENPEKYDRTVLYLGKILLRGEIVP